MRAIPPRRHFGKKNSMHVFTHDLCEKKPKSKTSDMKLAGCVQVQVLLLTYSKLELSKPGIRHHQREGSRSVQHPPRWGPLLNITHNFSKIFPERREGRKKRRYGENALIHLLTTAQAFLHQRETPSTTTVTSKCAGRL